MTDAAHVLAEAGRLLAAPDGGARGPEGAGTMARLDALLDDAALDPGIRARAAERLGDLALRRGEAGGRAAAMRARLERARDARRQPDLLDAHLALAAFLRAVGDGDGAESAARNAVQQARARGEPRRLGLALLELGRTQERLARPDRALLAYVEAVGALAPGGAPELGAARAAVAALGAVPGGAR